jgi:hypothetical protein
MKEFAGEDESSEGEPVAQLFFGDRAFVFRDRAFIFRSRAFVFGPAYLLLGGAAL